MAPQRAALEEEYEGRAKMVTIADCGDLSLED